MFVTNWISPTKIQKISEITNFLGTISYPELRYIFLMNLNRSCFGAVLGAKSRQCKIKWRLFL